MKKTLVTGFLILSNSLFGQIPGKRIDGPIVIFDTLTIKEGDVVFLGSGSDPNTGNFAHITTPRKYMTDLSGNKSYKEFKNTPQGISNKYSGRAFAIKYFKKVSSKKKGDMILGVIDIGPSFDGKLDLGMYKQAVNFEAAILAGEIIKINEINFARPGRTIKRDIPYFTISKDSVQPVVVVFDGTSKHELYARTLNWYDDYYKDKDESSITTVENEEARIVALKKGFVVARIMGADLFGDIEYRFKIKFIGSEIHLNFSFDVEDGQITEDVSQQSGDSVDKHGKTRKMSEDLKVRMEQMMNEISASLVDYLMK